ncbi:MAG: histidinol dehydrogenase [Actinomycetota bacterium]
MTLQIVDLRVASTERPAPRRLTLGADVVASAREIVSRVREEGDDALVDLALRFDGADLRRSGVIAGPDELQAAERVVPADLVGAIEAMIDRLRALHERQLPSEWWTEADGVMCGEIVRPLARAGCYVPGGRAAYPSTACMTVVPARVAGVGEAVVCSPPLPDGTIPPLVLVAARRAGADLVVKAGGAQAIAALAYGTASVPAVDTIVGPGNVYVTAAKREVAGDVGIDALAGPSELAIVADDTAEPELLAADLMAQAEHDPLAATSLVTTSEELVRLVDEALQRDVARAARRDIVERAIGGSRAVIVADEEAAALVVNDLAPEHLEVIVEDARSFLGLVRNAGAVFLGPSSAVPFGDYGVGSNHVLPTMGTARFSSGLRASDFVTVSAVVEVSPEAAARVGREVALVARAEGLDGHARAVELRAREGFVADA